MGKTRYIPYLNFGFEIKDVLQLANIPFDSTKERMYIRCPRCGSEHNRHLTVDLRAQVFACPVCHEGGGVLDFYSFLQGWELTRENRKKSLNAINEKMGINPTEKSGKTERRYSMTRQISIPLASVDARNRAYQALLSQLPLSKKHENALMDRGLTKQSIQKHGYRSFSSDSGERALHYLLENYIPLLGIPGFYYDHGWKIRKFQRDGILIPIREVITGRILGLQIRFDNGKSRYAWFSTDGLFSTSISRWCHFVGASDSEIYLITEGALKANVIHELTGLSVIGLAGTGAIELLPRMITQLKQKKRDPMVFLDALDMDFITNPNVSKDRIRLHELLKKENVYLVLMWPPEQKGLDDYMNYLKEKGGIKRCRTICSQLILEMQKRKQKAGYSSFLGYLGIL